MSVLNFSTSLESMVLSSGLMMRDFRCAQATAEECVAVINASIWAMEPTQEQIDRGVHGGQEFHGCPQVSDSSSTAEPSMTADPATSSALASSAFKDEAVIPAIHACTLRGGEDISPALAWSNALNGTGVLALVVDDNFPRVELETTHASIVKSATFPPMYPCSRKDKP